MSLSTERRNIILSLSASLIEAAKMKRGTIHILSGLPGIGKTHSVNTYIKPQALKEGLEYRFLNCYMSRDDVLELKPKPQTIYILDEFDTLFSQNDTGKGEQLLFLRELVSYNPILGLMNDFTVELRMQLTVSLKSELKVHLHSFPSPSLAELESISKNLFEDAKLTATNPKVFTFLASQAANQRNGDIRTLVRTVKILRLIKDGASDTNSLRGELEDVCLNDIHRALHQVLQREVAPEKFLQLSELEAGILSVLLDHSDQSDGGINVLTIRREYRTTTGVDVDVPETSVVCGLNSLLNRGLVLEATDLNRTSNMKQVSIRTQMKKSTAGFSNRKYYRANTSRYSLIHLRNACRVALSAFKK